MNETIFKSFEDIQYRNRDITSIEMECDEVALFCTTGKIKVWFGKQISSDMVKKVLTSFSTIDSSFVHEKEIVCDYDTIALYENYDYTLISYGKTHGGYKVIFSIPLSKQKALDCFIESVILELTKGEINKVFHWNGSMARLELIFNELRSSGKWNITKVEYREEK